MMWNWLVGGLSRGATLYLYDGSPTYQYKDTLIKFCEKEKIKVSLHEDNVYNEAKNILLDLNQYHDIFLPREDNVISD